MVKVLMSCEDGARTSIRPFEALSFLGKRSKNILLRRSLPPLPIGACRNTSDSTVVVVQLSLQTSGFSPLILARNGSALTWLVNNTCATFHRHLWGYLITQQYV